MSAHDEDYVLTDDGQTRGVVGAYGEPTDDELAAINAMARTRLTRDDVYVVDARPSDTGNDTYYTHMDPDTTLANFAEDASEGVPILNGHGRSRGYGAADLPIGRSFAGQLVRETLTTPRGMHIKASKTKPAVYSAFYLPRKLTTSTTSNDDIIRAIETGVLTDVSVQFGDKPGKVRGDGGYWYRCDECGQDMMRSRECTHYPGMLVKSENGNKSHRVTATVVDAGLKEYSPVWLGANGGASMPSRMADKMTDLVQRGVLSQAEVLDIDRVTGQRMAAVLDWERLKGTRRTIDMAQGTTEDGKTAPAQTEDERRQAVLDASLRGDQDDGKDGGEGDADEERTTTDPAPTGDGSGNQTQTTDHPLVVALRDAGIADDGALRTLIAQASDGRQYRGDLVELCHKAGVRAMGASYRRETNERMLGQLSVTELQDELSGRNEAARQRFSKDDPATDRDATRDKLAERVGGRQTVTTAQSAPPSGEKTAPAPRRNTSVYSTRNKARK
jgi:hypothetical protein